MGLLSNLFPNSSGATTRYWCRPTHKTNCVYVTGGNACCVCIPTTATCFIIEMWGQGGGGSGSCCCSYSPVGGQGGSYGWVACTTSNINHILCACACACTCYSPNMGFFAGSSGQISRVCNCTCAISHTVTGGCGGTSNCAMSYYFGGYCSGQCGSTMEFNPGHSHWAIQCCYIGLWNNNMLYGGYCDNGPIGGSQWFTCSAVTPFQQIQGTNIYGETCACCTQFNFYVNGACGWTSPSQIFQYGSSEGLTSTAPTNVYCGYYNGRGGASYAGAKSQLLDVCGVSGGYQYSGCNGNMPGGGGSSGQASNSGGCFCGGCGGSGLILISWQ